MPKGPLPVAESVLVDCPQYAGFERRVTLEGTEDVRSQPVPGFPYLRVNRFLASFSGQLQGIEQRQAWLQRLAALGQDARRVAWGNLQTPPSPALAAQIESCIGNALREASVQPAFWRQLFAAVRSPDHYIGSWRLLGLYPVTRPFVLQGYRRWQARWAPQGDSFVLPEGSWTLYQPVATPPLSAQARSRWLRTARRTDPLGIPALEAAQLNALFDHYQPRFLVQTLGDFDRIGQPVWRNGALAVDLRDPLHYRLSSYTRFGDTVLLQLNYVIWFPRRPPTSRGDIYAGELDGLIWRVTLDSEGRVFAYDSIHPCGCYHKLYPVVGGARLRPLDPSQEQPLVYPPLDSLAQPLVVIASGHHYVLAAGNPENWLPREPGRAAVRVSTGLPYESLLSMPAGTGRRSLFGRDGLVAGSERPERFVLWPMGILSPGAMRVWGTHAISFTGRRHFDGARLLEEFFWLREPGSGGADG